MPIKDQEELEFVEFIKRETFSGSIKWEQIRCNHEECIYKSELNTYRFEITISSNSSVFLWLRTNNEDVENKSVFYSKNDDRIEIFDELLDKIMGKDFMWPEKKKTIFSKFLDDNAVDFLREKRINDILD